MPSCMGSTPSTWLMVSATCANVILEHIGFYHLRALLTSICDIYIHSKVSGLNPTHCFSVKVDLDRQKDHCLSFFMNENGALRLDSSMQSYT